MVLKDRAYFPRAQGKSNEKTIQNLENRKDHAFELTGKLQMLSNTWKEENLNRSDTEVGRILPKGNSALVQIEEDVDLEFLRSAFGFEIVAEYDEGFAIVATEDIELNKLTKSIKAFENNEKKSGSVAKVYDINPHDKLQHILSEELYKKWIHIKDDTACTVDISIECTGTTIPPQNKIEKTKSETEEEFQAKKEKWEEKLTFAYQEYDKLKSEREDQLQQLVNFYKGNILQIVDNQTYNAVEFYDSFSIRVEISGKGLKDIAANYPYIFEISEAEEIVIINDHNEINNLYENGLTVLPPRANAPRICVIDSGINEEHVLLKESIVREASYNFLPDGNGVGDEIENGGHGTRIAGAIQFYNEIPKNGIFQSPFWLENARVLNKDGVIPKTIQPALLLINIVDKYYKFTEQRTRIFNHSISSSIACKISRMSVWAACMDSLSYDNDIVFVQSIGNISSFSEQALNPGILNYLRNGKNYPEYLLEDAARAANPGQAFMGVTVGAICLADFQNENLKSLGGKWDPSPFSRSGPGIWGVIKPDVVEIGGSYAVNYAQPITLQQLNELSLESVRSSPPGPLTSRDFIGTSISTPRVSHILGKIEGQYPEESALMYRALLIHSARWPHWAQNIDKSQYQAVLRKIGYGVPSLDRALYSSDSRVTLYSRGNIRILNKDLHVYKIPIPEEIRRAGNEYNILVEVTVAYKAKPRRTRKNPKKYLSNRVDWVSSNIGESTEEFLKCVKYSEDGHEDRNGHSIKWVIGDKENTGQTRNLKRTMGVNQKDWAVIKAYELTDGFCIAVRGREGWDKAGKYPAEYTLIVSFEILDAEVEIYDQIRIEVENQVQVQQQIPIEIEI